MFHTRCLFSYFIFHTWIQVLWLLHNVKSCCIISVGWAFRSPQGKNRLLCPRGHPDKKTGTHDPQTEGSQLYDIYQLVPSIFMRWSFWSATRGWRTRKFATFPACFVAAVSRKRGARSCSGKTEGGWCKRSSESKERNFGRQCGGDAQEYCCQQLQQFRRNKNPELTRRMSIEIQNYLWRHSNHQYTQIIHALPLFSTIK